jgi:hypothetical protein
MDRPLLYPVYGHCRRKPAFPLLGIKIDTYLDFTAAMHMDSASLTYSNLIKPLIKFQLIFGVFKQDNRVISRFYMHPVRLGSFEDGSDSPFAWYSYQYNSGDAVPL